MIVFNNKTLSENFYIKNNSPYYFNKNRTGIFTKESDEYIKKYKIKNLINCLEKRNLSYGFDIFRERNTMEFMFNGTNYGVILRLSAINYSLHLFKKFFENKKILVQHTNHDCFECYGKYNNNKKEFDKEINNLVVLSSGLKHRIIDWNIVNNLLKEKNSYLKLHPIMDKPTQDKLISKFGSSKIISSDYYLDDLIKKSKTIAVTACSESLITISLLGKNIIFLNKPYANINETLTTYFLLYYSLYNNIKIKNILNNYSIGLIPWNKLDDSNFINDLIDFNVDEYENWKNSSSDYIIK